MRAHPSHIASTRRHQAAVITSQYDGSERTVASMSRRAATNNRSVRGPARECRREATDRSRRPKRRVPRKERVATSAGAKGPSRGAAILSLQPRLRALQECAVQTAGLMLILGSACARPGADGSFPTARRGARVRSAAGVSAGATRETAFGEQQNRAAIWTGEPGARAVPRRRCTCTHPVRRA